MLPLNPSRQEVLQLWCELGAIAIDADDSLEEPFYEFTIDEHILNVWSWFDQFIPVNELLYSQPNY